MNKFKETVVVLLIIALFMLPQACMFIAENEIEIPNPNDYARITDMEYKAVVVDEPGCNGKVVVTERITFDVHAASRDNPFWELWRDLCEDYVDGVRVHYKVNSVKQILPGGKEVEWEESPRLYWEDYDYVSSNQTLGPEKWFHSPGPYNEYSRDYECVFFYIDGVYREEMVFEIEYEMYNAVMRYEDCADLYLPMFSDEGTKYLNSFKAEILIPEDKMPEAGNYQAFTYGTVANEFPFEESRSTNPGYYTFSFDLDKNDLKFKPYNDYIEFELVSYGEDKHVFAEYASENDYYYDEALSEILDEQREHAERPQNAIKIKWIVFGICIFIIALLVFGVMQKIKNVKKRCPLYEANPHNDTFRDIPSDLDPNFASALVFAKDKAPKDDSGVYSSLLLSLARKEYIDIQDIGTNIYLTINDASKYAVPAEDPEPQPFGYEHVPTEYQNVNTDGLTFSSFVDPNVATEIPHKESKPYDPDEQYGPPLVDIPYKPPMAFDQNQSTPDISSANDFNQYGSHHTQNANSAYSMDELFSDSTFESDVATEDPDPIGIGPYDWQAQGDSNPLRQAMKNAEQGQNSFGQPANPNYGNVDDNYSSSNSYNEYEPVQPVVPMVDTREPLTICEQYYFDLIKRHAINGSITMSALQSRISTDYDYTSAFVKKVERSVVDCGISQNYFQKADYKEPKRTLSSASTTAIVWGIVILLANFLIAKTPLDLAFGGLIALGITCILAGIYLKTNSHKYVLFTEYGEQEYKKWRGLYNFLKSDTLIKERTVVELPLWEKYLVYATAFGISEKVIAAIKIRCPEATTSVEMRSIVHNTYCRSGRIRVSGRSFHSSIRSGSRPRSYSGGGYGGSYGGRGGGYGGGGH